MFQVDQFVQSKVFRFFSIETAKSMLDLLRDESALKPDNVIEDFPVSAPRIKTNDA